jgi:hypothetical protein
MQQSGGLLTLDGLLVIASEEGSTPQEGGPVAEGEDVVVVNPSGRLRGQG